MKSNFNDCVERVLKDEGGYSNDPADSGGATNLGITQKETTKDVRTLTVADAKNIYKSKYWDACNCDSLSSGVDYTVFDYGVNSGVGRSKKVLQKFKSLEGNELIDAINNERTAFLRSLAATRKKDEKFLSGWLNRVNRVRNYSHYLEAHQPQPPKKVPAPAKGLIAVILAGAAAISQYFHQHEVAIIIGTIVVSIATGIGIYIYKNRK